MKAVYLNGVTKDKRNIDLFEIMERLYLWKRAFHICNVDEELMKKIIFYNDFGYDLNNPNFIGVYNPIYDRIFLRDNMLMGEYIFDGEYINYCSDNLSFLRSKTTYQKYGGNRIYTTATLEDIIEYYYDNYKTTDEKKVVLYKKK